MTDINLLYFGEAMRQAREYGNNELLIKYIESGDPIVMEHEEARKLFVDFLRGESPLGTGKKGRTKKIKEKRNEKIIMSIYLLNGYGIPIKYENKKGNRNATTIVGERFDLDHETVIGIWKNRGANRGTWIMLKNIGEEQKIGGHEIMDLLPPP